MKYDLGDVVVSKRNRLPHWHAEHAIYFITWHLNDALPSDVIARFRQRRDDELARVQELRGGVSHAEQRAVESVFIETCERFLDEHAGECLLRDPRAATIVADAIKFFDGDRYTLYTWCVMPNHVHVLLSCLGIHATSDILHSLKGFTSKEINKLLGRSGVRWQSESFDRCVRDSEEFERTIEYVVNNPIKAGLDNWPFVQTHPDRIAAAL